MLQQRAALNSNDCLPLLAQFLYEWHMVVSIYRDLGSGSEKDTKIPNLHHDELQKWLRIRDESAIASAFRLLRMESEATEVFAAVKNIRPEDMDAASYRALTDDGNVVASPEALLYWCRETQSRNLITSEQKRRPRRSKRPEA